MKIISSILLLFPIVLFSQTDYKKEAEYLKKNCNKEALHKAEKIYTKLQPQQMENAFDTTLKKYYEFLESTNCSKFNTLLKSAWETDKIINEKAFKTFFYNSKKNYNVFITGYTLKKPFRVANKNNINQGIDDSLQAKMLQYVEFNSKEDLHKVVAINIEQLKGIELSHFISTVEAHFGLKDFEKELVEKSFIAKFPYDLDFLLTRLIRLKTDKTILENILNEKKNIWDKDNWSEKFWSMIKQENLNIKEEEFYQITSENKKEYDVKAFIKIHQDHNLIGTNPLLIVDHDIVNYKENTILEVLEKIDIKDMQIDPKQNTVKLYGARGADGVLRVLSN